MEKLNNLISLAGRKFRVSNFTPDLISSFFSPINHDRQVVQNLGLHLTQNNWRNS